MWRYNHIARIMLLILNLNLKLWPPTGGLRFLFNETHLKIVRVTCILLYNVKRC